MKLPLTCLCGGTLRIASHLEGEPIACPTCGITNTLTVPVAGIPQTSAREVLLPSWIVFPILGFLTIVSGLIVIVGAWLAQPAIESAAYAQAAPPAVNAKTPPVPETPKKSAQAEPVVPSITLNPAHQEVGEETKPRSESFVLPRRMPSRAFAPVPEPVKNAVEFPPMSPPEKGDSRIVWVIEKPASNLIPPVEVAKGEIGNLHYSLRRLRLPDDSAKQLRLAVTPAVHDDVGSILARMGDGYRFTTLRNQDLFAYPTLQNHDVVFLTCADITPPDFQAAYHLRRFVEQGGTLYASDLRGDVVLAAFPEFRSHRPIVPGVAQMVEANVVDAGLQTYLQRKTIPLTFDASNWRPAAFNTAKVTVCLKGAYRDLNGQTAIAPLLVKFRVKQGTVIFTSFHHAKNDTGIVRQLLDYLVFASVNARSEARVRELMQRYDFAPQDLRPAVLNAGQKTEATFQHAGGGLQFALGFEHQGARLKLTLRSPAGQIIEHEDQGIFLIEVQKAPAGAWQYTITPTELPHPNFAIVVAVGAIKS